MLAVCMAANVLNKDKSFDYEVNSGERDTQELLIRDEKKRRIQEEGEDRMGTEATSS